MYMIFETQEQKDEAIEAKKAELAEIEEATIKTAE